MELHMPIWQRKGRFLWFQIVHAIYKDSSPTNMKNNQSQTPGACLVHLGVQDKKGPVFYGEGCQLYLCHLSMRNTIVSLNAFST